MACRVCLTVDTKLLFLHTNKLADLYTELISTPVSPKDGLPQYICIYCSALMLKAVEFRRKCRSTAMFLQNQLAKGPLSPDFFQNVDKTNFKLPYTKLPLTVVSEPGTPTLDVSNVDHQRPVFVKEPVKELKLEDFLRDFNPDDDNDNDDKHREFVSVKDEFLVEVNDQQDCCNKNGVMMKVDADYGDFCNKNDDIFNDNVDTNKYVHRSSNNDVLYLDSSDEESLNSNDDLFNDNDDTSNGFVETSKIIKQKTNSSVKRKVAAKNKKVATKKNTSNSKIVKRYRKNDLEKFKQSGNKLRQTMYHYITNKYKEKHLDEQNNEDVIPVVTDEDFTNADSNDYKVKQLEINTDIVNDNTAPMSVRIFYAYIRDYYLLKKKRTDITLPEDVSLNSVNEEETVTEQVKKYSRFSQKALDDGRKKRLDNFVKDHNFTVVVQNTVEEQKQQIAKMAARYNKCRIQCERCYQGFSLQQKYENHLRTAHDPSMGPEECIVCGKRFVKARHLFLHSLLHKYLLQCNDCGWLCRHVKEGMEHERTHKKHMYPCAFCPRVFVRYKTRVYHLRLVHSRVRCDLCYRKITNERALVLHRKRVHFETFPCEVCKTVFNTDQARDFHITTTPENIPCTELRACALCGVNFGSDTEKQEHIDERHSKGEGQCEPPCCPCKCRDKDKIVTKNKPNMRKRRRCGCYCTSDMQKNTEERRRVRMKEIMCEICARSGFQSMTHLLMHQRSHTGEKPYECDQCGKKFTTKKSLTEHISLHTGESKHTCEICGKMFRYISNLGRHVKMVHLKQRRHQCALCGKRYSCSSALKMHVNTAHLQMPWPKRNRSQRNNSKK